jgi:hypothetical protein
MVEYKEFKRNKFTYLVGSNGEIIRKESYISNGKSNKLRSSKKLNGTITKKGYLAVELEGKFYFIHRLVAICFIPNLNNKEQINHKDGNKLNNNVENLEWVTNKENMEHSYKNGFHINHFGEKARNFKYKFICEEHKEWGELTALEMANKINNYIENVGNLKATSSNIRTRLSAYNLNFKKIEKKVG